MQVILEHIDGEVVCTYEAKETASGLVCEITKQELEKIMHLSHAQVKPYLKGLYSRELKKLTPNTK